jgi:hypothetical protein
MAHTLVKVFCPSRAALQTICIVKVRIRLCDVAGAARRAEHPEQQNHHVKAAAGSVATRMIKTCADLLIVTCD